MELSVENLEGGVRCISLSGRLDMKGTQAVESDFTAQVGSLKESVIVDMSKVEFIASVGVRMLLSNFKMLASAGARMVLLRPPRMVEDILNLAGLDRIIPIFHDVPSAMTLIKTTLRR